MWLWVLIKIISVSFYDAISVNASIFNFHKGTSFQVCLVIFFFCIASSFIVLDRYFFYVIFSYEKGNIFESKSCLEAKAKIFE